MPDDVDFKTGSENGDFYLTKIELIAYSSVEIYIYIFIQFKIKLLNTHKCRIFNPMPPHYNP